MSNVKILLIVEGEKTETKFISRLTKVYGLNCSIYTVGTNLFALYDKLKQNDYQCDIKDILREFNISDDKKKLLCDNFTYTYLVFDSELQDQRPHERALPPPLNLLISRNIDRLIEMASFFDDETDPSKGKLYINYPMMESYKYSDVFFDKQFIYNVIALSNIPKFKSIAATKKLSGHHIDDYSKDDFEDLMRTHVNKLAYMFGSEPFSDISYQSYLNYASGEKIAVIQKDFITSNSLLHVLNSSLFFMIDYFGNRDGFYDSIMKNNTNLKYISFNNTR